jgi:hypothetical protein
LYRIIQRYRLRMRSFYAYNLSKHLPAAPSVLSAAYVALVIAWIFSNPAGVGPDEAQHYLKAFAAGSGEILLDDRPPPLGKVEGPPQRQRAVRFMGRQTRMVSVPRRLSPEAFACRAIPGQIEPCPAEGGSGSGTAELGTYVGTYPPWPYILPGWAMRLGGTATEALLAARLAGGLASGGLLAIAIAALWGGKRPHIAVTGAIVAVTPMVIFVSSTLSGSGLEVASAVCFFCCCASIFRNAEAPVEQAQGKEQANAPRWIWAAAGLSGVLLATGRDLGALWTSLIFIFAAASAGRGRVRSAFRRAGKWGYGAAAAVLAAGVAGVAWAAAVQARPRTDPGALVRAMDFSPGLFGRVLREQIGIFGPLDTVMPVAAYFLWGLMIAALLALGFYAGTTRQRLVLVGAVAVGAVLTSFFDAVQALIGFDAQGRHLLPLAVAVPLLAALMAAETEKMPGLLKRRTAPLFFAGLAAPVHAIAWLTVARRYAVGPAGPLDFLEQSRWTPPAGWILWGVAAAAGSALLFLSAMLSGAVAPAGTRNHSRGQAALENRR